MEGLWIGELSCLFGLWPTAVFPCVAMEAPPCHLVADSCHLVAEDPAARFRLTPVQWSSAASASITGHIPTPSRPPCVLSAWACKLPWPYQCTLSVLLCRILLWELLTGKSPFSDMTPLQVWCTSMFLG